MQIKNFKVKKKRQLLYKSYKEKLQNEENEVKERFLKEEHDLKEKKKEVIPKSNEPKEKRIPREKKVKVIKEAKLPVLDVTITIAIASLNNKCGCSYVTQAIAKYIKTKINSSVCIVDLQEKNNENTSNNIFTFKSVDICNLYDKYKYIILDVGNLNTISDEEKNEFRRSNIKIIVSKLEEDCLRQIAELIREDKKSVKKWAFLFNYVAISLQRKVDELMENYEYYCLPLFDNDKLDDSTSKIFSSILKNKKRKS